MLKYLFIDGDNIPKLSCIRIFDKLRDKGWKICVVSCREDLIKNLYIKRYKFFKNECVFSCRGNNSSDLVISMFVGKTYALEPHAAVVVLSKDSFVKVLGDNLKDKGFIYYYPKIIEGKKQLKGYVASQLESFKRFDL